MKETGFRSMSKAAKSTITGEQLQWAKWDNTPFQLKAKSCVFIALRQEKTKLLRRLPKF